MAGNAANVFKLVWSIWVCYHFVLQVLKIINEIPIPKDISYMVMVNFVWSRTRSILLNDKCHLISYLKVRIVRAEVI